jgi:hypothetical protein
MPMQTAGSKAGEFGLREGFSSLHLALVACKDGNEATSPGGCPAEAERRMADDEGYPPSRQGVARWASQTLKGPALGLMVPS